MRDAMLAAGSLRTGGGSAVRHGPLQRAWGPGTSLAVQWLGLCASTAGGPGSIPGQGTEIPQVMPCSPKQTNKQTKNKTKCTGSWGRGQDKGNHILQERGRNLPKVTKQMGDRDLNPSLLVLGPEMQTPSRSASQT